MRALIQFGTPVALTTSYIAAYFSMPLVTDREAAGNGHDLLLCSAKAKGDVAMSMSYLLDSHISRISLKGGSRLTGRSSCGGGGSAAKLQRVSGCTGLTGEGGRLGRASSVGQGAVRPAGRFLDVSSSAPGRVGVHESPALPSSGRVLLYAGPFLLY